MSKKRVIVAGHLCVDMTPAFLSGFHGSLQDIMLPGKLTQMGPMTFSLGGAVANVGLCLKKLGSDVRLVGKVGDDPLGQMIIREMKKSGAAESVVCSAGTSTSYSIVLAPPRHDRTFLHNPGANDSFSADDIDVREIDDADLFHFGYPPLMRRMYENDGEELIRIFREVSGRGAVTSLDMAAIDPQSDAGGADWRKICERVMPYTDLFVPSIEELLYILDQDAWFALNEAAAGRDVTTILDLDRHVRPLADQLMEMGCRVVLIKCGAAGIYYRTAEKTALEAMCRRLGLSAETTGGKEGFEESFLPEKTVSAVGAGDTAIAAFIASLLAGCPIEKCARYAAAEGACCVAGYGALDAVCTLDEIDRKIAGGWERQHLIKI